MISKLRPEKRFHRSLADIPPDDRLGIEVARTISLNYSNQETSFTVGESVRDEDVFIVQSTATGDVNEGLMELLIMISACRTARYGLRTGTPALPDADLGNSARRITAVM